jgi:hypothetical protein
MKDKTDLYKEVSLELLQLLKDEGLDNIDDKLEQRAVILEGIDNIDEFRKLASKDGIIEIDKKISDLFNIKLNGAKQEIIGYRKSKQANNNYANLSKEKLNIFNKKV